MLSKCTVINLFILYVMPFGSGVTRFCNSQLNVLMAAIGVLSTLLPHESQHALLWWLSYRARDGLLSSSLLRLCKRSASCIFVSGQLPPNEQNCTT